MLKQRNSRKQGDVGLGVAIAYFTELGLTVSLPLTDNQPYDLVVDDGILKKVQIKTTTSRTGPAFNVELRTLMGTNIGKHDMRKFDPSEIDLLFVVSDDGKKYLIPANRITARSRMMVGGEKTKEFELSQQ